MVTRRVPPTAVVPFHYEKTGHITVTAHLAGKPVRLVVDTGAGRTCIHVGFLKRYKLDSTAKTERGGGVGTLTMKLATVTSHDLSLQGVDLTTFKLIALDLSHVIEGLKKEGVEGLVGVVGADILNRKHAVIDYARRIILLSR